MEPDFSATAVDLRKLIKALAAYGEQARLLALNLAVAAAKVKPADRDRRQLENDLFGLVTRMSALAGQVKEVAALAEKGVDRKRLKESDRLLGLLLEKGVFNDDVISHLERSLHDVLTITQRIAAQVGAPVPEPCPSDPA